MDSLAQRRHEVRNVLYNLKRQHGVLVDYHHVGPETSGFNVETGEQAINQIVPVKVLRGITYDVISFLKFEYDLGYIAANKNFTYGGTFEIGDRIFIFDAEDLSGNVPSLENHYIVFNSRRYEPKQIQTLDYEAGYVIHSRATQAQTLKRVISVSVQHGLIIEQEVTNE